MCVRERERERKTARDSERERERDGATVVVGRCSAHARGAGRGGKGFGGPDFSCIFLFFSLPAEEAARKFGFWKSRLKVIEHSQNSMRHVPLSPFMSFFI